MSKKAKCTSIGGQAVIEGVMMRGTSAMATCVRDNEGIIRTETKRVTPPKKRNLFFRLPIIRGVFSFISSLVTGTRILMRSAEVFGEAEPTKFEKWVSKKLKIDVNNVLITFSLVLGLALAILLFIFLPSQIRVGLEILFNVKFTVWAKNFIEGGLKLAVFISYILLCSLIKDVRRTFMYHGAEHKVISCYEHGLELNVANAKKSSRVHDRCGTTFMVFVMVISILVFALIESLVGSSIEGVFRLLLKIAVLPLVAGLSYELLKGLAKTDCFLVFPLKVPGLLLQRITTKEPTDDMLEVALLAFSTVLEMDNDPTIKEKQFVFAQKCSEVLEKTKKTLLKYGIDEKSEAEWIVSLSANLKRDDLKKDIFLTAKQVKKINRLVAERITGKPLWYCVGDVDFYGYTLKVNESVLIPRPETEELVYVAKQLNLTGKTVLDLCTGSGAIAIAIKKLTTANVYALDISESALEVAKQNATLNGADITFIKSDMFENLGELKFDLIISNPPYIKSEDIPKLQKEVKDFEPLSALDGGEDGLDFYRIISNRAKDYLVDGGVLLLECGIGQAKDIAELLNGYKTVEIIKDLEGIDRIIKAVV